MKLHQENLELIKDFISPIFSDYLNLYNENLYCPHAYARFKNEFSKLDIINNEIENSLKWKWGHANKSNYPQHHKNLVNEIRSLWPIFINKFSRPTPIETFNWWRSELNRPTTYISTVFITHLIHSTDEIPIIDQHNYRAMNILLKQVDFHTKFKKKPSNWQDIVNFQAFIIQLSDIMKVDMSKMDRFLMMYGKELKWNLP